MPESLKLSVDLGEAPEALYRAWLSSKGHSEMTGATAKVEPFVGGRHSAWDGYIWGETLELQEPKRILQAWRTSDFPKSAPDSRVEIRFSAIPGGARVTVTHTEIPDGQGKNYNLGWKKFYFDPMTKRFGAPKAAKRLKSKADKPTPKTTKVLPKKKAAKKALASARKKKVVQSRRPAKRAKK